MLQRLANRVVEGSSVTPVTAQRISAEQLEGPVLMAINMERHRAGLAPVGKLTVPLLREHMRGKTIGKGAYRPGQKTRDVLIQDYR